MLHSYFSVKKLVPALLALILILPKISSGQSAPVSNFRLQALAADAGKPSVYEVEFTATDTLEAEAEFVLDFPAGFDLSQLAIAGSAEIKGGFTVTHEKQQARVRRSGLGQKVLPGTTVRLRLGVIGNPENLEGDHQAKFQIKASARTALTVAQQQRIEFARESREE